MDRRLIVAHLDMARRHVAQSRVHVARQREFVFRLSRAGHDIAAAEALLEQFELSLQLHEQGVEQIEAELAAHDASRQSR